MQRRSLIAMALPAGADDVLRIGWDDYPPYQYAGLKGPNAPRGLDIELLEQIAAAAGQRLRWQRMPWARQLRDTEEGLLDLIPAATPTDERRRFAEFSQPYRNERIALICLAGRRLRLRSLRELRERGLSVGIIRGTALPPALAREFDAPALQALLKPLRANDLMLSMLRAGRVAYVLDDPLSLLARAAGEPGPALEIALELPASPVHVLVGRHALAAQPELLQRLDRGLQTARRLPAWAASHARYMPAGDNAALAGR